MSSLGQWGDLTEMQKVKKALPPKEKTETFTEKRVGTQTREFQTLEGRGRSLSISERHEQRVNTVISGTNTYTSGPWVHIGDTNRQHVHPGGTSHTPTDAPGMIGGSTTTPTQRQQLDDLPSTTRKSTTVWK